MTMLMYQIHFAGHDVLSGQLGEYTFIQLLRRRNPTHGAMNAFKESVTCYCLSLISSVKDNRSFLP